MHIFICICDIFLDSKVRLHYTKKDEKEKRLLMETYNKAFLIPDGITMNAVRTYETPEPNVNIFPHTHTHFELYFFIRGNCSYMVESGIFPLSFGTVIYTQPGELHSIQILKPCLYERYYFYIPRDKLLFCGLPSPLRFFTERKFGCGNALQLPMEIALDCQQRLQLMHSLYWRDDPEKSYRALAEFLTILSQINQIKESVSTETLLQQDNGLINQALRCINDELVSIHSTADLAQKLFVSREYLSRSFRQSMGISLKQYITTKRIELAKHLLQRGSPLSDVCAACGFQDYSHFITIFHRITGTTPARYQRLFQNSQNP